MIYNNFRMNIIRSAKFSLKFFRITDGSFIEKVRKTAKYCPQYHYHLSLQRKNMKINLQQHLKAKALEQTQGPDYYKRIMSKYFQIRRRMIEKGKQSMEQMKDDSLRQSVIKNIMKEGFQKLSLFYQSLQNLVEGRREVLQNEQFLFQDGKSVKQKRQNFERNIERFFGKKSAKGDKKSDISQEQ